MRRWVIGVVAVLFVGFLATSCLEASHMIMEPSLPSGEDVFATQTAHAVVEAGGEGANAAGEWPGRVRELTSLERLSCDQLKAASEGLDDETAAMLVGQYVADIEGLLQQGLIDPSGEPLELTDDERDAVLSHLTSLRDADGGYCGEDAAP